MNTRNVTNTAFVSYPATGMQLPNGRQLANSYDALYRRTLVQDVTNSVNVAAWQFFGPSRVAEVVLGNGLICTWMNNARTNSAVQPSVTNPSWGNQFSDRLGYDGAGRPITKRYLAGGIDGATGAYNDSSSVVGFTTEYDLASNKFYERHLHCEERSHLYEPFQYGAPTGGYDSLSRLRQYQRGTLSSNDGFEGSGGGSVATPITLPSTDTRRTYDLDSLGNWRRTVFTPEGGSQETEIRQHNGLNEITRIQNGASRITLTYDGVQGASNGNLANDGTRSYTWDALNRLLQVNRVSDNAIIGQYSYDALNRRIRKTVSNGGLSGTIPNGTTDCLYSGWRSIEERNPFGGGGSTDTPMAQYIWGIYLDECLQQRLLVALNNFAANSDLYPLQDLLYRTTGLADSSGTVREAYDCDAYGDTLVLRNGGNPPAAIAWTDSDTQVDSPACPFIFTGQRLDAETLLYYYKRRYYAPPLGCFISKDRPENYFVPYLYCVNRPLTYTDPIGLAGYDIKFIDYACNKYNLSVLGREQLHRAMADLKGPGGLAPKAAVEEEAASIAALGGKFIKIGGTALSIVFAWLALEETAQAGEIPTDWREGSAGDRKCSCECANFRATVIVPSFWNIFGKTEWSKRTQMSQWVNLGRMSANECESMEDEPRIVDETTEVGFAIYNTSWIRCRFGGSEHGRPTCCD